LAEGGPLDEEQDSSDETNYNAILIPGAKRSDDGSRKSRVEVLTEKVAFSVTGREWAAVSGEGLHVYSLDDDMIFDPIFLTETITPATIEAKVNLGDFGTAMRMAVHLNEFSLVKDVLERTPPGSIQQVVTTFGSENLERLIAFLTKSMENSPHVEFYLDWCLSTLQIHGAFIEKNRGPFMRALRSLFKVIQTRHDEIRPLYDSNKYSLSFIESHIDLLQTSTPI
jgi:periodic tryptophan protein 2